MSDRRDRRPRRLSALFRSLLKGPVGEEACDELDRQHAGVRARRGPLLAWLWYFGHLLILDTWALAAALRRLSRNPEAIDVRYALRGLRHSPGFTATVVLTLTLGIGANIAMVGIIDRIYFRPISLLKEPDTVHRVYLQRSSRTGRVTNHMMSRGRYLDLQDMTTSFSEMAGFYERQIPVGSGSATRERYVSAVTASYFDLFDGAPVRGRLFSADEDVAPVGAHVAVLSHNFWESEFDGRDVLGASLDVGSIRATIIGVAAPGFVGIDDANAPVAFIPMASLAAALDFSNDRTFYAYSRYDTAGMLVRRSPGVSVERASADLDRAYKMSWAKESAAAAVALPAIDIAEPGAFAGPIRRAAGPNPLPEMRIAFWVAGLSIIVLLVACANVANLWLARALQRARETSIRVSMGASRGRLIALAMTETTLVALAAAVGAMFVAQWGGSAVRQLLLPATETSLPTFTDWRIGGLTLIVALGVGLVTGVAPAYLASRRDAARALTTRVGGSTRLTNRLRSALVVAQGAFSVALLIGAALFMRSVAAIEAVPLGYELDQVLVASPIQRGTVLQASQQAELRRTLLGEAQRLPDVEAASWAGAAPLRGTVYQPPSVAGIESTADLGQFALYTIEPAYFEVMGTKILRGRALAAEDRFGAPLVTVVSHGMARALWPERDPLGECIRIGPVSSPCITVVGIAEDALQSAQYQVEARRFQYYVPIEQRPLNNVGLLLMRVRGDAAAQADSVRRVLQSQMPGASYVTVQSMSESLATVRRPWHLGATLFTVFGALVLLVAAIGLHGTIGYDLARRSQEFAVRVALGATRYQMMRIVVGQSLALAACGYAVGTGIALAAGPWLQPLLYRQSPIDAVAYGAVGVMIAVVALMASAPAAARAARSDPSLALRAD